MDCPNSVALIGTLGYTEENDQAFTRDTRTVECTDWGENKYMTGFLNPRPLGKHPPPYDGGGVVAGS